EPHQEALLGRGELLGPHGNDGPRAAIEGIHQHADEVRLQRYQQAALERAEAVEVEAREFRLLPAPGLETLYSYGSCGDARFGACKGLDYVAQPFRHALTDPVERRQRGHRTVIFCTEGKRLRLCLLTWRNGLGGALRLRRIGLRGAG